MVCYDFKHPTDATSPVKVHFDVDPASASFSITLSVEDPCYPFAVTDNMDGVIIEDLSEQSADGAILITP